MRTESLAVSDAEGLATLASRYDDLAMDGLPVKLVVDLGPGPYEGKAVVLDDFDRLGEVHVELRGKAGAPAVFKNCPFTVSAGSLSVSHVVFADSSRSSAMLDVETKEGVTLDHVAFVGNTITDKPGQVLARLTAGYGQAGQSAALTDVWFVSNKAKVRAGLVSIGSDRKGGSFASATLTRAAFVDNRTETAVRVGTTQRLDAAGLWLSQPADRGEDAGPWARIGQEVAAKLDVRGDIDRWSALLQVHPRYEGGTPIEVSAEKLHVREGGEAPKWLNVTAGPASGAVGPDVEAAAAAARRADSVP
ncbi:MAG: hypothetical protein EP330_07890 [Deltaproteobacteria bacterium]|nr:MAG: hypothetical protein EP330_07890 [Deltaproteobacteria bacterium]